MTHLVVVGASLAGLRAVEAVRRDGFDGEVTLIGAEEHLPYDRPPLSKEYLAAEECPDPRYREEETFAGDLDVELLLGTPASALDTAARTVTVGDRTVSYDGLVIATGAHARTLPGTEGLEGVHTVRTLDDAIALRAALRGGTSRLTVVGAGFIGSEVASVGRRLGLEVTILEALETPLARAVGERMGRALTHLHRRHGTEVHTGVAVEEVVSRDGRVRAVRLGDGTEITTDVLVVGIGARPATDWLEGSGLTLDDGVVADETLAAAPGVYVAGDVARWPNALFTDVAPGTMRLEHWTSAADQGGRAARHAVDPASARPYETVPYFWSDWYDGRVQFVGIAAGDHVEVVAGDDAEGGPFTAIYRAGGRIVGALAVDMPAEVMKYRRLIGARKSWDDALELAEQRRQQRAEKARQAAEQQGASA
ncbi:NAD(P)/FAD-dependent oxidoreductase [Actinomycetospora cinnamomea]|uniref:NAD/ferredoxin-dependent reductase-like protein n=1 Tax=Actinomycetospora cinnamomea TaxID=663609 RepID=A0A2U1FDG8_9PSEU|nr:FAD-dependent oxidoreductase [Actinomycetospora cinnamomea]PVZ10204.1 NAD/ferredoxin-dependent reductase-like protein [Actinomycetospora cinnamomea]